MLPLDPRCSFHVPLANGRTAQTQQTEPPLAEVQPKSTKRKLETDFPLTVAKVHGACLSSVDPMVGPKEMLRKNALETLWNESLP